MTSYLVLMLLVILFDINKAAATGEYFFNGALRKPGDLATIEWKECSEDSYTHEYCMNCAVSITCLRPGYTSAAIAEWCRLGQSCDPSDDYICQEQPVEDCLCDSPTGYQIDPLGQQNHNDESWYMECNVYGYNVHRNCEDGYFNTTDNECRHCPAGDPILGYEDCFTFDTCIKEGYFVHHGTKQCPPGAVIFEEQNGCVSPEGSFTCFQAGDFEDPFDCQRYQSCSLEDVFEENLSTPFCCSEDETFVEELGCVTDVSECSNTTEPCFSELISPTFCHQ